MVGRRCWAGLGWEEHKSYMSNKSPFIFFASWRMGVTQNVVVYTISGKKTPPSPQDAKPTVGRQKRKMANRRRRDGVGGHAVRKKK
jgi:hypothetical protein